ncbi:unnamed protein product [Acanthosepion pharaonis]|uniref:Ig-like domain-containing protein n=1 Tax=Acanthosepion pharaonis TaxID=158019 RepID=A0A812BMF1_ACAPH|nr:unnamed protein product [Sepia pharaonis]
MSITAQIVPAICTKQFRLPFERRDVILRLHEVLPSSVEYAKAVFSQKLKEEIKVEPNGTATLICEMVEESTTATWLKDGAILKADNRIEMISEKRTQKLIIHKVTSSDSGVYTCKVGNVSTTARLIVEEMKTEFTRKLTETIVKEKETATFTCETSKENMQSVWMKDGKQIKADKRIEIIREKKIHKLVIHEVTTADKGEYSCVIGSISTTAKLIVEEAVGDVESDEAAKKPEFTKKLTDQEVIEKDTATFVCEMSQENLKPIWMKGGQKLTADKKYEIITNKKIHKLIIHDVTMQDKSEYSCIFGETSTWAKLIVQEVKVEFSKKLNDLKVKEKETVTFVCELSEENVKPIWMKGGQQLKADKKHEMITEKKSQKLIIHDVTAEDKGEYTCIYRDTSTWAKLAVEGEWPRKLNN